MKLATISLGTLAAAVGLASLLGACNGLLGISAATLEVVDAGDAGVPRALTCEYYCQTIDANCTAKNAEYILGDCLAMCNAASFDLGDVSQTSGDTLGCRIHYAELAAKGDPASSCRSAGALGGGVCGDQACEHFCALDTTYCGQPPINLPAYASMQDCLDTCLPGDAGPGYAYVTDGGGTTGGYDLPPGGNTLNCRFYHLENAFPSPTAAKAHCQHTGPGGPPLPCN